MATTKSKTETTAEVSVEVRVWVQNSSKEITITVDSSAADMLEAAGAALADGTVLRLTDNRGRTVLVAGDRIAAIEVGAQTERRVGFAN
jgi:Protein of unknown function (DUF3107)